MKLISNDTNFKLNNSVITLGKFDGFHRGHMKLIEELNNSENSLEKVIFTFATSARECLRISGKEILSDAEKKHVYSRLQVDIIVEYPFTGEVMHMSPEDFVEDVIVDKLSAKKIVVGSDYRFGYKRSGDIHLLRELSGKYGYELVILDKVMYRDCEISSTRIRECISGGNMKMAAEMLGYQYFVKGEIVRGNQIGRTINLPTINQVPDKYKILPPNGVYASSVIIDGERFYGITNVGCKPTVKSDPAMTVETFIFDFDRDVYGKEAIVEFYDFIRPETKFDGINQLKYQIDEDIAKIMENFKKIFS